MACMKLGSKSDIFYLDANTWLCSSGLASDIKIKIGEVSFHLHKFPLISRSKLLENMINEIPENKLEWGGKSVLELHNIPGGERSFLFVAKFCYGVKIDLNVKNVVILRCASDFLQMSEDCAEGNLIMQTENFLDEVFGSWDDTMEAILACNEVLPHAEELHIVSRGIDSLATKACANPNLSSWRISAHGEPQSPSESVWNGIHITQNPLTVREEWWYEDVCFLKLPLYRRLILVVYDKGMTPTRIAGSLMCYARKHLPLSGRQSRIEKENCSDPGPNAMMYEDGHRNLLEEIVVLLPSDKGTSSSKFLLRLLRTSMILHATPACIEKLEKIIGMQLDEVTLEDLLIPTMGNSEETLYDIDCMQRIVDQFLLVEDDTIHYASNSLMDEDKDAYKSTSRSLPPITKVANLVDNYLAEVAPDVNLKLIKFQSLAAIIPDYGRVSDDGLYHAIDIYLKAHTWLTDLEREQLCRIMNCQKFSLEASSHAAQNERLPLRVIVQVVFFEQLHLRTSVAGRFFESEGIDRSRIPNGCTSLARTSCTIQQENSEEMEIVTVENMKERVFQLEKNYSNMKQQIDKLVKTKGSWNNFFTKIELRLKMMSCDKYPNNLGICQSENILVTRKSVKVTRKNS